MNLKHLIKDLKQLDIEGVKDVYFFNDEEGNNTYGSCIFNQYATAKTKIFIAPNEAEFVDFDLLMDVVDYSKLSLEELKKLAEENAK